MKYNQAMIAWNPNYDWIEKSGRVPGQVMVVAWPDRRGLSRPLLNTCGACYESLHELNEDQLIARLLIDFHTLVVRDGIDPQEAHRAFLNIDEYRKFIAPDIEGAK